MATAAKVAKAETAGHRVSAALAAARTETVEPADAVDSVDSAVTGGTAALVPADIRSASCACGPSVHSFLTPPTVWALQALPEETGPRTDSWVRPVTSDWHPEPPVDEAALLELLGNDRGLALELFHVFTEDMHHQRPALHAAALAGDVRDLIRLAHRLKGGTMNLGCTGASAIASEIEQHAGALDPSRIESLVRALDFEIDRCTQRMAVLRQAWGSGQ